MNIQEESATDWLQKRGTGWVEAHLHLKTQALKLAVMDMTV